jgi:DNA-binding NarL/FixJ family response regulator
MARVCCLAGAAPQDIALLTSALKAAGEPGAAIVARLDVAGLRKLAPAVLVADIDRLDVDPLEMLRQIRFVLSDCVIIVYTAIADPAWGLACHLAGAGGLLSKASRESELALGLRQAIRTGCFTDPRCVA